MPCTMRVLGLAVPLASHLIAGAGAAPRAKIECGAIGYTSSQEDCEIAQESATINSEKCPSEEPDPSVRDKLEGALHGENVLRKNLEEAETKEEFEKNLGDDIAGAVMPFSLIWPVVIMAGLGIWWFLGCCAMCPCCRRCRCCKKERGEMSKIWKIIFLLLFGVCLLGVIIGMSIATGGAGWIIEGWDTVQCTLTTLLGTVVSGSDPTWPTEKVNGLVDKLAPDDPFMVRTREILLQTEPVERSIKMLTGTMMLLDAAMSHPSNKRPISNSGEDLNHICHLCAGVAGQIAPVAEEIDSSLGKALEEARTQVNDKLSGQELLDLQDTLRDGVDPMNEVRDGVMDSVGKTFVKDGLFKDIEEILGLIATVVLLLSLVALIPTCCGLCAVSLAAFKPLRSEPAADGNIYRSSPHRCACCSWCCGIAFASLHLLLAYVFASATVPLANVCLVLDDLKGETFDKWAPALGVKKDDIEPEDWANTLKVVDACTNRDVPGQLLNAITVKNKEDDGRISIRDKLLEETRGKIDEEFDKIKDKNVDSSLLDSEDMKEMFKLLEMPVDSLITFDPDRIESLQSQPDFAGFALAPQVSVTAFATSASCDSITVDADGPMKDTPVAGEEVPGINKFREELKNEGLSGDCAGSDCTCSMNGGNSQLRSAANALLRIKQDLRSSFNFRCDLFVDKQGNECDPKLFTRDGLAPDCVQKGADGKYTTVTKRIDCSFTDFVQYVKDFKPRLEAGVAYLEGEAEELLPTIADELKAHIDTGLLDGIFEIVDLVTCDPFKKTFHGSIDGICYHAVRGLIDIAEGMKVLGAFLVVLCCLMYYFWRRGVDNITVRNYKVAHGMESNAAGGPQEAGKIQVGSSPAQPV
eukprot:gnl/MRDRNA2_/MRDRNA2_29645_c0_seq1.p1 gnl/MRDRNA2_/MRDRNA2_29645_c0~~gnl/MRDRNA2_/MRDRNA2_29645_c0_seq1.p1  ORF type:complete len:866 (-),score=142.80 gnl/MRDRNA2_/MRDRNA2_29645_c0_seq1:160-2757(-)